MNYIPEFIGLQYGSDRFYQELDKLRHKMISAGELDEDDNIFPICRTIKELKESEDLLIRIAAKDLEEVYPNEILMLLLKKSDYSQISIMRAWSVMEKEQGELIEGNPEVLDHVSLMPRYKGFEPGKAPFTKELMRCLLITLERFQHLDDYYYPSIYSGVDVADSSSTSRTDVIDNIERGLKARFKSIHAQDILLDDEIVPVYKNILREMHDLIDLRIRSIHGLSHDEVMDNAFKPYVFNAAELNLPEGEEIKTLPQTLEDPNQLLDMTLRISANAISVLIYDYQMYQLKLKQQKPDIEAEILAAAEDDDGSHTELNKAVIAARISNYEARIEELNAEIGAIYTYISGASYDSVNAIDRLKISAEKAKGFKDMFNEVLGDLAKIASMCGKRSPKLSLEQLMHKRMLSCNDLIFKNRIKKVTAAVVKHISGIEKLIPKIQMPDEDIFNLLKNHLDRAREFTVVSSGDIKAFVSMESDYKASMSAVLQAVARTDDDYSRGKKTVKILIENLDKIVRSKRECECAFEEIKERVNGKMPVHELLYKVHKQLKKSKQLLGEIESEVNRSHQPPTLTKICSDALFGPRISAAEFGRNVKSWANSKLLNVGIKGFGAALKGANTALERLEGLAEKAKNNAQAR